MEDTEGPNVIDQMLRAGYSHSEAKNRKKKANRLAEELSTNHNIDQNKLKSRIAVKLSGEKSIEEIRGEIESKYSRGVNSESGSIADITVSNDHLSKISKEGSDEKARQRIKKRYLIANDLASDLDADPAELRDIAVAENPDPASSSLIKKRIREVYSTRQQAEKVDSIAERLASKFDVDASTAGEHLSALIESGLSIEDARQQIEQKHSTAERLASKFDVDASTAEEHLSALIESGLSTEDAEQRAEKRYSIVEEVASDSYVDSDDLIDRIYDEYPDSASASVIKKSVDKHYTDKNKSESQSNKDTNSADIQHSTEESRTKKDDCTTDTQPRCDDVITAVYNQHNIRISRGKFRRAVKNKIKSIDRPIDQETAAMLAYRGLNDQVDSTTEEDQRVSTVVGIGPIAEDMASQFDVEHSTAKQHLSILYEDGGSIEDARQQIEQRYAIVEDLASDSYVDSADLRDRIIREYPCSASASMVRKSVSKHYISDTSGESQPDRAVDSEIAEGTDPDRTSAEQSTTDHHRRDIDVVTREFNQLNPDVSLEEFRGAVENKVEQMGGLADEETAAKLISHELKNNVVTSIADIEPGMDEVEFLGKVVSIGDLRTFEHDDQGSKDDHVVNVEVADETGRIRTSMWNRLADTVIDNAESDDSEAFNIGDVLRIAGQPKDNHNGLEINVNEVAPDENAEIALAKDELQGEDSANDKQWDVDKHVERLASSLEVSKRNIRTDLESMLRYNVPLKEAKITIRRKHGAVDSSEREDPEPRAFVEPTVEAVIDSDPQINTTTASRQVNPIPDTIPQAPNVAVEYTALTEGEPIGRGGNANVRKANLTDLNADVTLAIKEPRMAGTLHTEAIERIVNEAETWNKLDQHEHIITVVDYDREPLPWIAMEYMDGGHLGERNGKLETQQALWTAIAITKAVCHAHSRGVAHLDLKPENILFHSIDEAWDIPKVADWGLSKHLLNHSKSVEGLSPQYAAPEQFEEDYGSQDDITDIYQLGAVFYELFTGQPPFEGKPAKVMRKVLDEQPTPPTEVADLPDELDDILLTALAKEKSDRYEHVLYFRDRLQDIFDSSVANHRKIN